MMCQPAAFADGDIRPLKSLKSLRSLRTLRTLRQRAAVIPAARKSKITICGLKDLRVLRNFKVIKGLKETHPADLTAAGVMPAAKPYSRRHSVAG